MGVSKMISYHLVLLLSHLAQVYLQTTPDVSCCEWKSVKNSAESFLDGWYQLKEIKDDKPEDVCGDSCVYTQVPSDGYDYCFKDEASSSEVFCEATGQYPVPFLGQGNQSTGQFPVPFESNFT